jgi:hypothetical protein
MAHDIHKEISSEINGEGERLSEHISTRRKASL